ncbi:MAG TPA: hypothetical protein VHX38_01160 [Pseudonocardiaceae bacterium]|jgi:hypothetical protein|nr:hypothetical protein [Pseudonocardiaceae bacterium]
MVDSDSRIASLLVAANRHESEEATDSRQVNKVHPIGNTISGVKSQQGICIILSKVPKEEPRVALEIWYQQGAARNTGGHGPNLAA